MIKYKKEGNKLSAIAEKYIRENAKKQNLFFTEHALIRMNERKIRDYQVYDCAANGKFIEAQDHGRDIKIVFQEIDSGDALYYVIVAACNPPTVVTVCSTKQEVWDYLDGFFEEKREVLTFMKCFMCGSDMKMVTRSINTGWGDYDLTIKGVKAHECTECDNVLYDPKEVNMIQNLCQGIFESTSISKPDYLNVEEVAGLLRVSNQSIYNMIKDGRLSAVKAGREWRFLKQDILKLLRPQSAENTLKIAASNGTITEKDKMFMEELVRGD